MTRAPLSASQLQMRMIFDALRDSGAGGASRADLVTVTGLSLWQVRQALVMLVGRRWILERRMVEEKQKPFRYWTYSRWWRR